ncbi:MAG: glycosyltransferase family 39 protein [Pseudomonadota bacterium]
MNQLMDQTPARTGAGAQKRSPRTARQPRLRSNAIAFVAYGVLLTAFSIMVSFAGNRSMPVIDRDEARFAQATTQMLETGDYVVIRYKDRERNKKPAGLHWVQAASTALLADVEDRNIAAYRAPSAAAAVITALTTFFLGASLFSPAVGFLAGMFMAASPLLAGQATLAKTDAMLTASVAISQTALVLLYVGHTKAKTLWAMLFWIGLIIGVFVKGPIAPLISGLTVTVMAIRDRTRGRRLSWLKSLKPILGVLVLAVAIAPWAIAIGLETEGRFFTEAIGRDLAGKLQSAQEQHTGPVGYHFLLVWVMLLPAAALLAPGLAYAVACRRGRTAFALLAWAIPTWVVMEATATKLPHYTLPLYPALAILAARASIGAEAKRRLASARVSLAAFALSGGVAAGLVAAFPIIFREGAVSFDRDTNDIGAAILSAVNFSPVAFLCAGLALVGALIATREFWRNRRVAGALTAIGVSALVVVSLVKVSMPTMPALRVSERLSATLDTLDLHPRLDGAAAPALIGYHEPSAVFLLGTDVFLGEGPEALAYVAETPENRLLIVEGRWTPDAFSAARDHALWLTPIAELSGFNYSKGDWVTLTLYRAKSQVTDQKVFEPIAVPHSPTQQGRQ